MRLWKSGKSKSLASAKYAAIDTSHNQEIIHILRALLREATYLPDPASRQYFHRYIVSRFRVYHPRTTLSTYSQNQRSTPVVTERVPSLLRTARQGLLFLQRANDGHYRHLGKVLAMTYGLIGKRRHKLLEPLKIPDVPVDQTSIEQLSDARSQGVPHPSSKLSTMIRAQGNRKITFFSRNTKPTLEPKIPEKNAWMRPMPVKRARNMQRKWYGEVLDRIMPPLPEDEWHRLRRLASGEAKWEGPVPRRHRLRLELKRPKIDIVRGTITNGTGFSSNPHELTGRYMRRLWAKIFAQCPMVWPDERKRLGYNASYGETQKEKTLALRTQSASASANALAMFQGVNEKGKLMRSV